MPSLNTFTHATFCWPELCSANPNAANAFYQALFAWDITEQHMPDGAYTLYKIGTDSVAGMYQTTPERIAAGVNPHWNLYIAVQDVHATAAQCEKLGGKILMPPTEIDGLLIANLQDPQGADFCITRNTGDTTATRLWEPNTLCWAELYTPDTQAAIHFYTTLLGWTTQSIQGADQKPYTIWQPQGHPNGTGGMVQQTPDMPGPPRWLPYFMVQNFTQTLNKAQSLGAQITFQSTNIPHVGSIAILLDEEKAQFCIIEPNPEG